MSARRTLVDLVTAVAKPGGAAWLAESIAAVAAGDNDIAVLFPGVSRKVGRDGLGAPADTRVDGVSVAAWRVDDAARVALVLAAAERAPDAALGVARALYFTGDTRERAGALRALSFLLTAGSGPAAPVALDAVLDALRTNQGLLFEAALCENRYASTVLPDHEFRKAVLKAVFIGVSVRRIENLASRADAELSRSLMDYVAEREAATRSVPAELWPIIALHPVPGAAAKLIGYLEHPDAEHRRAAAEGLGHLRRGDDRVDGFLRDRAEREADDAVKRAITDALVTR